MIDNQWLGIGIIMFLAGMIVVPLMYVTIRVALHNDRKDGGNTWWLPK